MAATTSRALALLALLQTHRQWSGPVLATRLGVTERTLRRDIEQLRELGYAVAATRGALGGYRLELPPDAVDAVRFERLARTGRVALQESDTHTARSALGEALALWRGAALADVADEPFAAADIARLDELRLAATEDRAQAELLGGAEPAVLVAELTALTTAHPRRERAQALLLRATVVQQ